MARHLMLSEQQELALEQQALQQNLQATLPQAFQQAGIQIQMVQSYIPALLQALVPLLAKANLRAYRGAGSARFVREDAPLAQQIMGADPNGFTAAARAVPQPMRTAMDPLPQPQILRPAQPVPQPAQYPMPQQIQPGMPPIPPAQLQPLPPGFVNGEPPSGLEQLQ